MCSTDVRVIITPMRTNWSKGVIASAVGVLMVVERVDRLRGLTIRQ